MINFTNRTFFSYHNNDFSIESLEVIRIDDVWSYEDMCKKMPYVIDCFNAYTSAKTSFFLIGTDLNFPKCGIPICFQNEDKIEYFSIFQTVNKGTLDVDGNITRSILQKAKESGEKALNRVFTIISNIINEAKDYPAYWIELKKEFEWMKN